MSRKNRPKPKPLPPQLAALKGSWRRGQPVPAPLREHAVHLHSSGVGPGALARLIGVSPEAIRLWVNGARVSGSVPEVTPSSVLEGTPAPSAPSSTQEVVTSGDAPVSRDNAHGLSAAEVAAILDIKKRHPSMGPAQIRVQLKRFKGWRLSVRAIGRALTRNGYELVHLGSRPKDEVIRRFEAPHRNAIWQMDFVELRVGPERVSLLVILDDFSRYCVGWALLTEPTSEAVVGVVKEAIRRHGKPESVYTDRGGAFLAWRNPSSLERFLEDELIDHHIGPSYRPQGRGKVEALAATVQRELWNIVGFESIEEAREALRGFFRAYNEHRAHMGIDGLTPADRYFGRWEEVKAKVEAVSRRRQGALASGEGGGLIEEVSALGGPAEVLRLMIVDGRLELRFLGHRVDVGPIEA